MSGNYILYTRNPLLLYMHKWMAIIQTITDIHYVHEYNQCNL
jgi:hypothetical protein